MFFRILKNDLKRKKTTNIILFLFIILTTMFVASGINNVITVINGTNYYLDKAGIGDYIIITMGDHAIGCLDEMLKTEPAIENYRLEQVVFGAYGDVTAPDGSKMECKNTTIYQSINDSAMHFFDKDNQEITTIEPGHIYVSSVFVKDNNLKPGDTLYLNHNGVELAFVLDGMAKDALFGSNFMGNTRFLLNDEDMQKLLENETISSHYRGEICYIKTDDVSAMSSAITKVSNVTFSSPRSTIKTCYVMEMIVAFLMLMLSVCLIVVSFVVLKFSITFTIADEFREIGVMKAIGISNRKIRSLYIIKYLLMAIVGAVVGFFASIPFGSVLLKAVSQKMVLGSTGGLFLNVFGSLLVICLIVLFAYRCTKKIEKSTPLDAIRNGQTGERYKNKSVLRIKRWPLNNATFMAINDVLSSPKRFLTIALSFGICTLFVLILVNTIATIKSPNLIYTFGTKTDLYMTDVSAAMKGMLGSKEEMINNLDTMAAQLTEKGMPARCCVEIQYKYPITFEGKDFTLTCQQGLHTNISDYMFTEGSMPESPHEIAITPQIAEITGAGIGDVMTIHFGEKDLDCMVTGYIQTMNNLGELIRLHEDAPTDFSYISSMLHFQIDFTDAPSEEEIEHRKERIKELYATDKVMNTTEYCIDCTGGVADTLEGVQYLFLGITLTVIVLVTILMERSFIADEKGQIATLKAIGFTDRAVIKWQVYRFELIGLISVISAAILSIPMTKLCITPIFGMMGATEIEYNIEPLRIFVLYPGIVLLVTIAMAWLMALYTKMITSSDTADIE